MLHLLNIVLFPFFLSLFSFFLLKHLHKTKRTVTNRWPWQRLKALRILRCDSLWAAPRRALLCWQWWGSAGVGRGPGLPFCVLWNHGNGALIFDWEIFYKKGLELLIIFIIWFRGEGQVWRQPPLPRGSKPSKWRSRGDHPGAIRPLEMAEESQPGQSPAEPCGASPGRVSVPTPSIYLVAQTYF